MCQDSTRMYHGLYNCVPLVCGTRLNPSQSIGPPLAKRRLTRAPSRRPRRQNAAQRQRRAARSELQMLRRKCGAVPAPRKGLLGVGPGQGCARSALRGPHNISQVPRRSWGARVCMGRPENVLVPEGPWVGVGCRCSRGVPPLDCMPGLRGSPQLP